jgi:hypothetical protein
MFTFVEEQDGSHTPLLKAGTELHDHPERTRVVGATILDGESTVFFVHTVPSESPN